MKWPTPKEGDERVVERFAWLPVELSDGRTVWLERYTSVEARKYVRAVSPEGWHSYMVLRWVSVERRGLP